MFTPVNYGGHNPPAVEYLPAGAITPKFGMAVALNPSTGYLAASAKPTHISVMEASAALTAGTIIPVIRISDNIVFESTLDGTTTLKAGALADVDSTGMLIDGDGSTNKVFLIEVLEGTAQGSKVRGRFVRSDGQDNVDATST
nr:MAG TPA_asm: hypothetical protein [Caudoviricetes sp.]DAQ25072.1 MAG TPA: hypothetical protein [Caudoviricetes sp.]